MEKLSVKDRIFIGLTLFSMFFGAGNLIFPPFMGAQAGNHVWLAMIGFAVSAIGLPVLGVAAVALSDGLPKLAGRVHPMFASVFTMLIYLSIGPCLAIPRTAGTSFEMAVVPFLEEGAKKGPWLAFYSAAFFVVAMLLALKPDKLSDRLGKILAPVLLILIAVVFAGCQLGAGGSYGAAMGSYQANALSQGFLDGYQTMDTIAALNFGIIIAMNIRAMGIKREGAVVRETIFSGVGAGVCLLLVYSALSQIGAAAGAHFAPGENGAQTLSQMVGYLFGHGGNIILGAIFFIACLNTCTGLLSCCSEYFHSLWPRVGYRSWVFIFAASSAVIANAGLTAILKISIPVLNVLYPMAIMLIVLAFLHHRLEKYPAVYPWVILLTGLESLIYVLQNEGFVLPVIGEQLASIPLYSMGLGWIWTAVVGMVIGIIRKK